MRGNRTFLFIAIMIFLLGIIITNSSNIQMPDSDNEVSGDYNGDADEEPGYDYQKRIVVEETSNLFVRIARLFQSLLNRSVNMFVNLIQRIFGVVFGT